MRVSNDTLRSAFLSALESAQRRVIDTQEKVSSGKRVNKPSDDPVAAARIAHLDASLSRLDQYKSNSDFARNQLGLEESALNSVMDNLQRIRELTLQANNATTSDSDRKDIAAEIRQARDALLALANTTDVDGRHLFGGYVEGAAAFTTTSTGNVVYNGDQGQRSLQISDSRFVAINDSGSDVFQKIPQGNGTFTLAANPANSGSGTLGAGTVLNSAAWVRDTYRIDFLTPTTYEVRDSANALVSSGAFTAGQSISFRGIEVPIGGNPASGDSFTVAPAGNRDVFSMLDSLIASLEAPANGSAQRAQLNSSLGQRISDLDNTLAHISDVRGEIGARVRALDQQDSLSADFALHLNSTLSSVRDLDYADALSRLQQEMFGLEAAQQTFARTQDLSLFKYL
jgi:flagellar hook-associated protein 3 FlgL